VSPPLSAAALGLAFGFALALPAVAQQAPAPAPAAPTQAAPPAEASILRIGFLRLKPERLALSILDYRAEDDGLAGARLAIEDNNTTGRFTRQHFELVEATAPDAAGVAPAFQSLVGQGVRFVLADLPADLLLSTADAARQAGVVLLNVGAPDDALRGADCRANVIHVAPSRAMLADALAQYLAWKKWPRWFLIVGSHPADQLYAEAVRRAAKRFGAEIVEERVYEDTGGARRTDSGHVQVQRQMPVFTQGAAEHDVVVVADESEVFGTYVPYRTAVPRPVAGTAGLTPTSWSPAHEQWGALQLQDRFHDLAKRQMTATDANAWTAVRILGEAATRANSTDPPAVESFMLSPDFAVAAFKGQKLSLRPWDRQLRQPVLLADGETVVSVSPQEGFLHQFSELDTLGADQPETECRLQ